MLALAFVVLTAQATAGQAPGAPRSGAPGAEPEARIAPEPTPRIVDPAAEADLPPTFLDDAELARLAQQDIAAARPVLRRSARSAASLATRALAVRLLATYDPGTATARICARALRVDVEPGVRRGAAECLGRLGPEVGGPHTPALVAALGDGNIDVVTMAGWALANVGDAPAIAAVAERTRHPDVRVSRLFLGYAERMQARLGLYTEARGDEVERDAEGRRLIPPGYLLVAQAHGLDLAVSTGWLGLYGGVLGWYHGAFLLSAHGGQAGADASALGGLGGAAVGAALASAYAFTRADSLPLAHTVVQMGTLGTFAGFGAGMLSGFPPASSVAAANLSAAGTLAGTAAGIALVEARPPTVGALGLGMVTGLSVGTATGALWSGYRLGPQFSIGASLLVGSVAGAASTIAAADLDIGLFPLAGAATGGLLGAGASAAVFYGVEPNGFTEATGWGIASATLAGTALGAVGGMLLPRDIDPLLKPELQLFPPLIGAAIGKDGEAVPTLAFGGAF
jgi:hypothetical protein